MAAPEIHDARPVLLVSDIAATLGYDDTPYDAPHGFREFGKQDPDGYDIAFGRPLD